MDIETIKNLLDLLNPLHGELDRQTYDQKKRDNFDAMPDSEYSVDITVRMERDLTQAVMILEDRLRQDGGRPEIVDDIACLKAERDASLLVQRNSSIALDAMREALQQIEDKYAAIMRDPPDWVRLTPEQLKWVREAWYGASLISRKALGTI